MGLFRGRVWFRYRAVWQLVKFVFWWKSFFLKSLQFVIPCVGKRLLLMTWHTEQSLSNLKRTWYRDHWQSTKLHEIVQHWVFAASRAAFYWFFVLFVRCFHRGCWWLGEDEYFWTCFWFDWNGWCQKLRRLTFWCWRWRWLEMSWLFMID